MMLKDRFAKAWAEDLTQRVGLPCFPSRHDGLTAPPFGVVLVKQMEQTVPGSDVWTAEVRVVLVSDTSETGVVQQSEWLEAARAGIEATPRPAWDAQNRVRLYGFMIETVEQVTAQDDQGRRIYSDVLMIRAGVGGSAG